MTDKFAKIEVARERLDIEVPRVEPIYSENEPVPESPPPCDYDDVPLAQAAAPVRVNGHARHDAEGERPPAPMSPRKPIHWAEFEGRDPPPRTWWLQDWLGPSPTLLAGAGGKGKSSIAQTLGTALATTRNYIAAVAAPLRVLIWFCEDDKNEVWRRQVAICGHFGIQLSDLDDALIIVPRIGCENTLFAMAFGTPGATPLIDELRQQLGDYRADVLILDNIAQVFGANSNDPHHVTQFVNGIQGLVPDRPFAPIFLGHTARSEGSEFSGSAAWENAVRMRWYLGTTLPDQKPDVDDPIDPNVVFLAKRKANYSAKDYRRLTFRNGLFVPDEAEGARFDSGYQAIRAEQVVLVGMAKLAIAGVLPTDGKTSGDYLPSQLVAKGHAAGFGKRELAAAMNRLMGGGKLKREVVGQYSNRSPRFGLVTVGS